MRPMPDHGASPGEHFAADLIEAAADEIDTAGGSLAHAYQELSAGYRSGRATPDDARLTDEHVLAYLAARLPATAAVTRTVLQDAAERRPDWQPVSSLDLGAGPGTASWAAASVFPSLERATLVERSSAMIRVGRRLAGRAAARAVRSAEWSRGSVVAAPPGPADLVIASYVLGEVDPGDLTTAVGRWWEATLGELVIVEPGTPAGFARILQARTALLAAGATITAPCPADAACPMADGDWCHFGKRIARTSLHRVVKDAALGFEDEKYTYVVASRGRSAHAAARLLRVPQSRSGHIRLTLCEAPSVRETVVPRSRRDDYRWARRAHWGDPVPPGVAGAPSPPADTAADPE